MAELVSIEWLTHHINHVKLLDCTWVMTNETTQLPEGVIPSAQYFDIDKIADLSSSMAHMLPSNDVFAKAASKMGIKNSDHVICYDRHGIRAAPRVWWTFKTFGHETVSILDGGLPSWIKAELETALEYHTPTNASHFQIKSSTLKVASSDTVLKAIGTKTQIIDARPSGRFYGTVPEPRKGLRSGRIPGSISLPFSSLKKEDGAFKSLSTLASLIGSLGIDLNKPIMTSCGSGVTAAGLIFIFHRLGAKDLTLYDGSWTEWGASNLPLEL